MQADIAPNSDSTMRYSQGASSPVRTQVRERLDDVRLRRDRVGRDDLGAAAARPPGHGLGALDLLKHRRASPACVRDVLVGAAAAARGVAVAHRAGEPGEDRVADGVQRHHPGEGGEGPQQRGVRERPAEVLAGELGGRDGDHVRRGQATGQRRRARARRGPARC